MESDKSKMKPKIKGYLTIVIVILVLFRLSSCSAPKIAPYSENMELPSETLREGRKHFNHHCATCHPGGMSGLGPAIINKPLPEFLIKFQIRNGVGVMPAFDEKSISDEQVDNIAEYLVFLRKK